MYRLFESHRCNTRGSAADEQAQCRKSKPGSGIACVIRGSSVASCYYCVTLEESVERRARQLAMARVALLKLGP
jgi:hypothetical protein